MSEFNYTSCLLNMTDNKTNRYHLSFACTKKYVYVICILLATIILYVIHYGQEPLLNKWRTGQATHTVKFVTTHPEDHLNDHKQLQCYNVAKPTMKDILKTDHPPPKSIFFLETSCASHKASRITITKRQACSVESAARIHPNRTIYLLFASPGVLHNKKTESDLMLRALVNFENVKILHVNVTNFLKKTPLEKFYKNGRLRNSKYEMIHTSDMLRLLTLWRYGGIYLDLDVIVLKSLDSLSENFAVAETNNVVANGILGFNDDKGQQFLDSCLENFKDNYSPDKWSENGPFVLTRVAKKICQTGETVNMTFQNCNGFQVYPSSYFFPVAWSVWKKRLFGNEYSQNVMKAIENSYGVHAWNRDSASTTLLLNSTAPFIQVAKKFCPKVMSLCKNNF